MTFAGYFQSGTYGVAVSTLGSGPFGEPAEIPYHALVFIVTDAPEGAATQKTVEDKMISPSSGIALTVRPEPDCPDDIKEQIKAAIGNPLSKVNEVHWDRLRAS